MGITCSSCFRKHEVLAMSESDKMSSTGERIETPPLPDLLSPSEILQEEHIRELNKLLPARTIGYPWTRMFSTSENGFNLKTMYRMISEYDTPIIITVEDTEGASFGAVLSSPIRVSDRFCGNGESCLFTLQPELKVFRWKGENDYFFKGSVDSMAVGAGDGKFGLWIDGDLNNGRSQNCQTYGNDVLSSKEDFIVKTLEVWGFI